MLCSRCLLRALRRESRRALLSTVQSARALSSTPQFLSAQNFVSPNTVTQSDPPPSNRPPAPTSSTATQPLSTPLSPSPSYFAISAAPSHPPRTTHATIPVSSCPAGTILKGINHHKNKQDPLAMEDHEYPAWLWDCLQDKRTRAKDEAERGVGGQGDLFSKSKKQRRVAAKRLRRATAGADPASLEPPIPLYEQSADLPAGDGSMEGEFVAAEKRSELTRAMRGKRRASIKERNFLTGMR